MAALNQALKGLADESEPMTSVDLAKKVGSTEDTIRGQCSKLKTKGYVDGSTKVGWVITAEGREALERQEKIPVTAKDVGADTESKLKYYGQLSTVEADLILATAELIMSGDPEDLTHVWDAMTTMDVPIAARRKWWHLWRNYLKQGIPPSLQERVVGINEEKKEGDAESVSVGDKDKGRDYIIEDDMPIYVGPGSGDMSMKDAKDIIGMRAIRARHSGQLGGAAQQFRVEDIISILDKVKEVRGGEGSAAKTYVVQPTDQGTVVKEVQPGEPLVVPSTGGNQPPATYFVDNDGNVKQVQPGEPIVLKQQSTNPPTQKTLIVRQTAEGIVTEEVEPGKPIILEQNRPSGGGMQGLPFPVFGSDGKPAHDGEGRPIYADLEPTMRWLEFQSQEKRSNERHGALMGLVKTVQENVGDGIAALKAAAEQAKGGTGSGKTESEQQPQVFSCGDCETQFSAPPEWAGQPLTCPQCGREYSKEELLA